MKFEISIEDARRIDVWLRETVYPEIIAWQKKDIKDPDFNYRDSWEAGYPYQGAIGGGLSYIFTPTSIGLAIHARYKTFEDEYTLDLTDYDAW